MKIVAFKSTSKDWKKAEIKAHNWFVKNGYTSDWMDLIQRNNRGFDILLEKKYRIDVKYANPKKSNENAFDFKLNKKKKVVKTTDYYLLMFKDLDKRDGKMKYRAFLLPYEDAHNTDVLTITKTCLKKWEPFKFTIHNLEKLGIHKQVKNGQVA